jgi:hypothetical protein
MFNHHNPLINIDHYNYFVRCVDRFRILLQKEEHKLFIMTFVNMNNIDENIKNEIIEFNNKFSKYTSNYTLLVIFHIPIPTHIPIPNKKRIVRNRIIRNIIIKKQNHHIFTYIDNIHFLELHTLSTSNGVEFNNSDDNIYLDNIINSKYNFNIKPLDE